MIYMGSKNRIAKEIIPIITKDLKQEQYYVEPFVGGANMINKIDHKLKIGADNNKYLIALLKYVQEGKPLPVYITRDEYAKVKANPSNYDDWYVAYVGFISSFRGKFYAGFIDDNYKSKTGKICNFQQQQRNNLLKLNLQAIKLINSSYDSLVIPDNSVIYCDPPYANTTGYKTGAFDHSLFWDWCRVKVKEGHKVYISEYNAPSDFTCIWKKEISSNLGGSGKRAIEKLFIHNTQKQIQTTK